MHNWVSGRRRVCDFMKSDLPADCDQAFTKKDTGSDNHAERVVVFLKLGQAVRRQTKTLRQNYQYSFHHNNYDGPFAIGWFVREMYSHS